jgi:hypothetical protein
MKLLGLPFSKALQAILNFACISSCLIGCGGGTYGTGGDDEGAGSIRLVDANGSPLANTSVRAAGVAAAKLTNLNGVARISFRSSFPIIPIQVLNTPNEPVYYVTAEALNSTAPFEIVVASKTSDGEFATDTAHPEQVASDPTQENCIDKVNTWITAIDAGSSGLSALQEAEIESLLSAPQSDSSCEAQLAAIEAVGFD